MEIKSWLNESLVIIAIYAARAVRGTWNIIGEVPFKDRAVGEDLLSYRAYNVPSEAPL